MSNKMKLDLNGKVGIVTGSASGIGREIALRLSSDGAKVVLADVNAEGINEVSDLINEYGESVAVKTDVTSEKDVKNMLDSCIEKYSKIDFIFSNAGIVGPYSFDDTTVEEWDSVFAVNVKGMFLCAKYALPHMKEKKQGRVVFTASTNAEKPGGYVIAYRASKAAVAMMAKSLALYAAPYNITVNSISPGVVLTPIEKKIIKEVIDKKGISFDEYVESRAKRVPMGRFTDVKDIADVAEFLLSDNASFITGQQIFVNGGEW